MGCYVAIRARCHHSPRLRAGQPTARNAAATRHRGNLHQDGRDEHQICHCPSYIRASHTGEASWVIGAGKRPTLMRIRGPRSQARISGMTRVVPHGSVQASCMCTGRLLSGTTEWRTRSESPRGLEKAEFRILGGGSDSGGGTPNRLCHDALVSMHR